MPKTPRLSVPRCDGCGKGPRLAAIILAAGKGGRMGRPKLSLELGGVAFWRLISKRLWQAGIGDIVVVVRRSQRGLVDGDRMARAVVNRRPLLGMFSSIQCGLRAMKGFSGYLICQVDHPAVQVRTYKKLARVFSRLPSSLVRPQYGGKPGHPIIIPGNIAENLRNISPCNRLDHWIKRKNLRIITVKVADKNIVLNINTNKELTIAKERHRPHSRRHKG